MNVSYNWLKEYVDFDLSPEELAAALTSTGLEIGEVEEVESIKGGLEGLVVGKVLTCVEHPDSDHLHITTVDLGKGEPVQIVCGAPNVAAGQKVVVATLGTVLYDGDNSFKIKKTKMRGVESLGMICSEVEIGVGSDSDGITVLPESVPAGTPAKEYYNVKSDYVLEVDITPNRADGCSHYGVARDIYAYLKQNGIVATLHKHDVKNFEVDNHNLDINVKVENTKACIRYAGLSMTGVTVKESPEWLKERLNSIGVRPINNVVDVTNYILFAYGQPLHCFDADMITTKTVEVKTLPEGTPFVTLDEQERKLSDKDLMICNGNEPMCIAGVFGGLKSGATEKTTNIFIESAYFHPTWVRKTARRFGLNTDASFRFERGVDPNAVIYCLQLAAILIKDLAGGQVSSEIKDFYPTPIEDFRVKLNFDKMNRLVGKEIPTDTVLRIVTSLEMKVLEQSAEGLTLAVPPYRADVHRDVDVIEDIMRIYGYNNIEISTSLKLSLSQKGEEDRSNKLQNLISEQLVGCGFNEIMNNSLTRSALYEDFKRFPAENLVMMLNPLSSDLNSMRQTLLFGGLSSISRNANRRNADLKFFEFGNCYFFDESKKSEGKGLAPYSEGYRLGMWVTGKRVANSWAHPDEDSSVYELKAYVDNVFARLGLAKAAMVEEVFNDELMASGLAYSTHGGKLLAVFGVITKKVTKGFDIDNEVYYAEFNWDELMKATRKNEINFKELPKYPAVRRDLALLLDKSVLFSDIEKVAFKSERKLLKSVSLFDVYEGNKLEAGKKSYAVCFMLQDESKTLNDKSIDKVMTKLIKNLEKELGAQLR
ncbi:MULTISPECIES: phenylalanine--tRNA ligase subunit beta [Bacteroides]|uniref:phenylalanine--tRNA ligase subunit beta n=1 Tax=Bacteroides TaxID=816 RepID=UPI001DAFB98F|nr:MULTISPECIES: phenylalanine--tRNA ligase subunit beta [Bacteroides]HJD92130.1 phenylalanine--tRNA ligase subunit beta [Bacteroides coprosuis]